MRLKVLTTTFMIVGLVLILALPWVLRTKPAKGAPKKEVVGYLTRVAVFQGAIVLCLTATGIMAILIVRRAREEYRKASLENLKFLMEATLQDHQRKKEDGEPGQ